MSRVAQTLRTEALTCSRRCNGKRVMSRQLRTSIAAKEIFDLTKEEEFTEKVLSSDRPVIVDFHANWCQPCKILAPKLKEAIEEYKDQVDLAQVDVDLFPDIAMSNDVTSIPAIQAFIKGKRTSQFVGVKDEKFLTDFVKDLIK